MEGRASTELEMWREAWLCSHAQRKRARQTEHVKVYWALGKVESVHLPKATLMVCVQWSCMVRATCQQDCSVCRAGHVREERKEMAS